MVKQKWQDVNSDEVKKILASPEFVNKSACGCEIPIYTFRKIGDTLEGRVRPCRNHDRADRARAAHIHTDEKNVVAIRLSKMLWQAINKNELWGRWVRIKYQGSQRTKYGHAKKIYLVEVDRGRGPALESVDMAGVESKSNKPRGKRKISRPMAAAK